MDLENINKTQGSRNEVKKPEREQMFSDEGLLNRNFGKDVEKPSNALFYRGGILNRPLFHETFGRVYKRTMEGGAEAPMAELHETASAAEPEVASRTPVTESQVGGEQVDEEMRNFFEVFKNEPDPEASAFEYIKNHLDPKLTLEEQLDKLREFGAEYRKYKKAIEAAFK